MTLVPILAVGAFLTLLVSVTIASYNRFVRQLHFMDNSWSNVETELQRRYDLIPNLVATVKGYAGHERATLENVIAARSGTMDIHDPDAKTEPENVLVNGLRQLLAVSEAYPDLRADIQFLDLQQQLVTTEDRIQAARRLFNGNVRDYNQRVESVPSNLVARVGNFTKREYLQIDEVVRVAGAPVIDLAA